MKISCRLNVKIYKKELLFRTNFSKRRGGSAILSRYILTRAGVTGRAVSDAEQEFETLDVANARLTGCISLASTYIHKDRSRWVAELVYGSRKEHRTTDSDNLQITP